MPPAPANAYPNFRERFDAAYRAELDAFIGVAQGRTANLCPPEEAEAALRVAVACDRSRAERRPVRVDEVY
jgi:myo-inositol 2-dehydrogenase/D-chiro-inositol 1-dehydrogenase